MKLKRSVLGPVLVVLVAFVSGGWLLQSGAAGEARAYEEQRVFEEVLQHLSRNFVDEHDRDELYRMAVEGLLRELGDPHTSFLSAEEYNELRVQTTGEYGGLGIQIAERNGWITIISTLPDTPAERAGLLAGDRIVEVEGESTEGWTDEDAVKALRGPKGVPVDIKIARVGIDEPIPYTVDRDEIHVRSVRSASIVEDGVGLIKLDVFSETSTEEVVAAVEQLRAEGLRGLILDLRTNPGGLLDQGVGVSDLFLEEGDAVVETRGRDRLDNITLRAREGEIAEGLPIVVLVDEFSASAAEIVAGALQDHDRALVIGQPTFGKGSVQTLVQLSGGNFLKLTTAKWYTPSGRSIQKDRPRMGDPAELVDEEPVGEDGRPVPMLEEGEGVDTISRETFRTEAGRVVYGGGGIVPDLIVAPDTLTEAEQAFFQAASRSGRTYSDVLYGYAVEFARQNPDLALNFAVTPAMRQELFRRLTDAGVEVSAEQFEQARRLIDQQLGGQIALARFGSAGQLQRAILTDKVVREAVELLQRADSPQALFELAERQNQVRTEAAR